MVKRKDLVDVSDKDYHQRQGEFMQCQLCGQEFGGTQGDYWQMDMNDAFTCIACMSENIALVRRISTIKIIKD